MKLLRSCSIFLTLVLFATPVFAVGPHDHLPTGLRPMGGLVIPGSFQGIYNYTEILRDCTTQVIFQTTTGMDTVCADDNGAPSDTAGLGNFSCEGTSTANEYNVMCIGSQEVTPGCVQHYTITVASTLNGDTVHSLTTISSNFTGCAVPFPPSCASIEYTGTRVGSATTECATPVQPTTWSGIKANYR